MIPRRNRFSCASSHTPKTFIYEIYELPKTDERVTAGSVRVCSYSKQHILVIRYYAMGDAGAKHPSFSRPYSLFRVLIFDQRIGFDGRRLGPTPLSFSPAWILLPGVAQPRL